MTLIEETNKLWDTLRTKSTEEGTSDFLQDIIHYVYRHFLPMCNPNYA